MWSRIPIRDKLFRPRAQREFRHRSGRGRFDGGVLSIGRPGRAGDRRPAGGSGPGSPAGCMPPGPGSPCSTATAARPERRPPSSTGWRCRRRLFRRPGRRRVDQAEAQLGPVSILVNNAGITGRTDLSWNLERRRGARGLRRQRDRPVPVLQGRGSADAGPRLRADRQRGLDRRQGGEPDPHALFGLEGGGHRPDQVAGQGAGRQGGHHGQRDLAGRDPHRDPRRRRARARSST